jgi:hypothetical protein
MKVANGDEKDDHAVLDPEIELSITKGMEIVFESIGGSILQVYVRERATRAQ